MNNFKKSIINTIYNVQNDNIFFNTYPQKLCIANVNSIFNNDLNVKSFKPLNDIKLSSEEVDTLISIYKYLLDTSNALTITNELIKFLKKYFYINIKNLKMLQSFKEYIFLLYNCFENYLDNQFEKNIVSVDCNDLNIYISCIVGHNTSKELHISNIIKVNEIKDFKLNKIEEINVTNYIRYNLNYTVGDEFFKSFLNKDELEFIGLYYDCGSYVNLSKEIKTSKTTARNKVLQILKKVSKNFYTLMGIVYIKLLLSNHDNYVTYNELYSILGETTKVFLSVVKNNLLSGLKCNDLYNIVYYSKKVINDKYLIKTYDGFILINKLIDMFKSININIDINIIKKRIERK